MKSDGWPRISEVIESLTELKAAIGDQQIRLIESALADVDLPGIDKLGVEIHGMNGHSEQQNRG